MKNCLVFETLNPINEMKATSSNDGLMHLKGTFGVCGVKNNNARIYEAGNYGKMVAEMKKRIEKSPILGELEHPQTMNITLENVSHKITDINIDENGVVSGEIVLLDTPKGKIAQAIVEGGAPLFISSRAQGNVDPRTSIVTLENLATYDLVGSPGFSQAELHLNEGMCAEAICESCGYIYEKNNDKNTMTNEETQKLLERLDTLEKSVNEMSETIKTLTEKNEELESLIDEHENIDLEKLANGIQKWIVEEYSPEVQSWVVEEFAPEVQDWVVEEFAPEVQDWVVEEFAPEVQNWVVEEYSPVAQQWCTEEFAKGIQNWFINECAPEFEGWVTEEYGPTITQQIDEAIKSGNKNSLSNIEQTLSLLEGIQVQKPVYGQPKQTTQNVNEARYITEMPADIKVKYELASKDVKESIDRKAKIFDFNRHTITEFWNSIDFEQIKPSSIITEHQTVVDEREKSIRESLRKWHGSRFV